MPRVARRLRPLRDDDPHPVEAFVSPAELTPELSLLVAQTFQALADPTRARIAYALADHPDDPPA